jgi:membrane protein
MVDDVFSRGRGDLLSIGFILTMYFASNGLEAMMRGFDKSYQLTFIKRNWLQRRLGALKMTFIIGVVCILSAIILLLSSIGISWLQNNTVMGGFEFFSFQLIRWIIILIIYFGAFSLIYHYAPSVNKKFAFFSPGTNVATLLSLFSSIAFTYFVNHFGNYNKFYGSLGTMVMIMLWLEINCFILLAGFELNASIAVNRDLKARKLKRKSKFKSTSL